uniref:Importin N-terminal domain-containing protein n=1 Tax=Ciona savignyi TaxID=51511 RepID=H2ZBW1_CIOSA
MNDTQMIIIALDTLFQPTSMPNARAEALRLCESYKTNVNCAEIGFQLLSDPALASHVRYFGLQLIKHRVRHNWTDMPYTEQVGIKSHILTHVSTCNVTEVGYIKTGLAGVLTELVKHTWPQHWPNMLGRGRGSKRTVIRWHNRSH